MKLESSVKEMLDSLVCEISQNYEPTVRSMKELALDNGINVICSKAVPTPTAASIRGKKYLISRRAMFKETTRYFFAHELGHLIIPEYAQDYDSLPHDYDRVALLSSEDEAEYFGAKFAGYSRFYGPKLAIDALLTIATNPIGCILSASPLYGNKMADVLIDRFEGPGADENAQTF
jgi:hypothetical protein